jgi:zinc-finger of transposase IS204/IS1001/IS1096/IS1165
MHEEISRMLGLAGLRITDVVIRDTHALELESVGSAEWCPRCGSEDLVIKERPRVGVRDLPVAGRVTRLL